MKYKIKRVQAKRILLQFTREQTNNILIYFDNEETFNIIHYMKIMDELKRHRKQNVTLNNKTNK